MTLGNMRELGVHHYWLSSIPASFAARFAGGAISVIVLARSSSRLFKPRSGGRLSSRGAFFSDRYARPNEMKYSNPTAVAGGKIELVWKREGEWSSQRRMLSYG